MNARSTPRLLFGEESRLVKLVLAICRPNHDGTSSEKVCLVNYPER
jgi:hypothetical protein